MNDIKINKRVFSRPPPLPPLSLSSLAVIGRSFVIQQIPSSNLFMVVVDNKCDCSMFEPITMNPVEIMYILGRPEAILAKGLCRAPPDMQVLVSECVPA